jgi:hypothetical protein
MLMLASPPDWLRAIQPLDHAPGMIVGWMVGADGLEPPTSSV